MSQWESNGKSNEWYTPKYVFDALNVTFDMDVAAPVDRTMCHVPANKFITSDSLNLVWNGFIWMNPPFGGRNGLQPWLDKINTHGNGISLTPDRTSTPWWQETADVSDGVLFVKGKIKFIKPDGTTGDQPGNGTTLFAYGEKAIQAMINADRAQLGSFLEESAINIVN